jgi:hypothetical protein
MAWHFLNSGWLGEAVEVVVAVLPVAHLQQQEQLPHLVQIFSSVRAGQLVLAEMPVTMAVWAVL